MLKYGPAEIRRATDLLMAMPRTPTGINCSNFPWPLTPVSPWDMNLTITDKSLHVFRQDELHTIQKTVSRDKLLSMVSSPKYVFASPKPKVVTVAGTHLIYDGHHRLATLWLFGENEVECEWLVAGETALAK